MRLEHLYSTLKGPEREALAKAVGITPGYLWQIATGWQGTKNGSPKRPSIELMAKLAQADARLHIADMVAEVAERASRAAPAEAAAQ